MPSPVSLPPPSGITLIALIALGAAGCPHQDVGAPCNHGQIEPPSTPTVTFPALSCDHLMCVYGNADEPPSGACREHADCNVGDETRFHCIDAHCEVAPSFVLSRSMCSRRCESDADCEDGDRSTACSTGFRCARIQSLGDFCCEKLCVCRDDLDEASADARDQACAASALTGCCDQDPVPAACGQ